MALVFAALLTAGFAPLIAIPLDCMILGFPIELSSIGFTLSVDNTIWWWINVGPHCVPGCLASFALFLSVFVLMQLSASSKERAADGGVLGEARVKTGPETIRGSEIWDGHGQPKSRGFVYGFEKTLFGSKYLFEPRRHMFLDGSTGAGKSRSLLIPTIDLLTYGADDGESRPQTIIVSDVKSELIELTGDELERRGYRVLLLDAQHPEKSDTFNPLEMVDRLANGGNLPGAEQAADAVARTLIAGEGDAKASHWTESARSLLAATILLVVLDEGCPRGCKHLATVYHIMCLGTEGAGEDPCEPLKGLFRSLPQGHPARSRASQFISSGGNELRSIVSTLKVNLRIYASAPIARMVSGDDIDPSRILSEKTALFLHVMDEGSPYNAIAAVLFEQLYAAVYSIADAAGGKLPRPVSILGDEWGNLPKVECLPSLLSLGRSYDLFWMGAVQNISQLNKYGERDGRKKILANCGVKVAMKLGEAEDRQYFTELVGKTTRHTMGTSSSRGPSGGTGSTSYSEHADDLIHPWEWTEMSPDKDGVIVVKTAENGVGREHAGCFRAPVCDCTRMPTKEHFDLGTREHEAAKRMEYQARLISRQMGREDGVDLWTPEFEEMDATREAAGHNRPGKQGARCTYMQHQVIGFNPDECSCNGGPMTPSRCMEYARDYIAKRYPNQEIVIVLHEERCRSDGSARFAAHLAINRTDLETGRRLNDGPARAAAKSRVRTVKELDTKYGLSQLERGLSNSKVHARQPGREEREMAKKGRSDKSENARVRAIVAQRAEEVGRLKSCPDRFGEFARRLESDGIEIARSKRGALQYRYHSESLGKTRKINGARLGYAVNRSTGRIMRFTARGIDLAIRAAWELAREGVDDERGRD